jgi:hypothetical protein
MIHAQSVTRTAMATTKAARLWITTVIVVALAVAMLWYGPIHQPLRYHDFADRRALLGVPNAGDVLSNIAFTLAGLWGLATWVRWSRRGDAPTSSGGYALFFMAMALTGLGSGYYHWAPDNARLVWDRLPIALACAGLLCAVYAETHEPKRPVAIVAALTVAAVGSVWWWAYTGRAGEGDLRPYLLLQLLPLVLIPTWQALSGTPRPQRIAFGTAIALYVVAKFAEIGDHYTFEATGFVSGHTLKHLLAAVAGLVIVADYRRRARTTTETGK